MTNTLDTYTPGMVVHHKATKKICVVISVDKEKGTVKVRTSDDLERDYFPQEMKTNDQVKAENDALSAQVNRDRPDWSI